MNILGNILFVIGCIVGLAGDVMFLNVVYRRSLAWFFGCLFLPFVDDVFLLMHWRAAWKPCVISLVGLLVAFVGALMAS